MTLVSLSHVVLEPLVRAALLEDIGLPGDITSNAVIAKEHRSSAFIVARKPGVIAGLDAAELAFHMVDPALVLEHRVEDGASVGAGEIIAEIRGPTRGILTGERTALNFLGHLSGIATVTASVVETIRSTGAAVDCTRKTTPGLRALEKYAVRAGGGMNHRFSLSDAVLIKDNHIAFAGGVAQAIRRAKACVGHMVKIEVEVDTLEQLDIALSEGVDAVLLDNMTTDQLRQAVVRVDGRAITEASGGITPSSAAAIAATGVDLISIGWLTHSAPTLDLGIDAKLER